MKRAFVIATTLGLAACSSMPAWLPGSGWVALIDGDQGLENFNRVGDANWRSEHGMIVADKGRGGHLVSKSSYKDFQMRAEFWAETDTNSGILIRCSSATQITVKNCYEVKIWDTRPDPRYGTGAIVNVAAVPVPITTKAGGRWNTYEITAKGNQLTVKLNGVQTVSVQNGRHAAGHLTLRYGPGVKGATSGPIKWRKVQIREL